MTDSIGNHSIHAIYPWQESQWQHFNTVRNSDHLPHALLLVGSDGIGKNDFANILANSLLCEQVNSAGYACGQCNSCKVKKSNSHPDYKYLGLPEGKQQIPVNAIRELTDFLYLSRSYNGYRVVVISSADKMNINAANSLLKSLEEPPPNTVIILVVDQLGKLPITIRSRCQVLAMTKPDEKTALSWLEQQKLNNPAENMLSLADNKPLLAIALDANEELLALRNKFAKDLISIIQRKSSVTVIAKDWEKTDLAMLLNWQIKWLYSVAKMVALEESDDVTNIQTNPQTGTKKETSKQEESKANPFLLYIQSSFYDAESLWKLYSELLQLKALTDYPLNRSMFTESMLLLWNDIGTSQ